ncbi:hypothetical protein ACVWY0_003952 [Arthrobacter sp. UYNi723]
MDKLTGFFRRNLVDVQNAVLAVKQAATTISKRLMKNQRSS